NPDTELAYLPPAAAHEFEVYRYVLVATAGMFAWELAVDLFNIYRMLFQSPLSLPAFFYILSRKASSILTIALARSLTPQPAIPVANCEALLICIGIFYCIGTSCTSLLFFFRIRAIFNDSPLIVGFFAFVWLFVLGGGIAVPFALTGMATHVGDTGMCLQSGARSFAGASFITSAAFDTLVFFFISFRLITTFVHEEGHLAHTPAQRLGVFIRHGLRGQGLPRFSRAVFQTGQQYYFVSLISNVITISIYLSTSTVPSSYRIMFTVPNLAIVNSMATRVFREVR
ncbi:hypothetical protein K488DRAFT_26525, partial [Vararia minispora EC-137]